MQHTASVVYVPRSGSTDAFTDRLDAAAAQIAREGFVVIAAVPNTALGETLGIWIFFGDRPHQMPTP